MLKLILTLQTGGTNKKTRAKKEKPAPASKSDGNKSKYFASGVETVAPNAGAVQSDEKKPTALAEKRRLSKESPVKAEGVRQSTRNATQKQYIDLDDEFEDSEEEFEPEVQDLEADDDDLMEIDANDEASEDHDMGDEDLQEEVEELKLKPVARPAPKPKTAKKAPSTATPKASGTGGVLADQILSTIPNADLPDAPENGGKLNYFALKNKQQTVAPPTGSADLPEAAPNCLGGLTIVFTGVLPNLERDAAESVAKQYGAKVTKSILKKTSLVVIGEEAGPSKVKKIKDFGIKAITEAGFIELLTKMPADGGDSVNAQAAKAKREREEEEILVQAQAEEDADRRAQEDADRRAEAERLTQRSKKLKVDKTEGKDESSPPRLAPEPRREIPNSEKLWTVKYAPSDINQLCGNKAQINKLRNWLSRWFDNAKKDFKVPGADGSGVFRAALILGAPGIGKTSAAHLVAKELGFDILEKNASDVRSKSLLNSDIKSVLNNTSVVGFFKHHNEVHKEENQTKFCLIMDEVDGMSSGDHGGAGALSAFCKITKMPMILICNDKSLPKMRTFDKVTYNLTFKRPSELEVRARLLTIAHREKLKLEPSVIGQLVQATGNDIRQMINLMSTVSKTQSVIGHENSKAIAASWKKHVMLKPFEITSTLLGGPIFHPSSGSTLNDKLDLYFNDIDFAPLMIQENYIFTRPNVTSPKEHLKRVASAADSISQSDGINSLIRSSEQQWSLLPFHGVMSTVRPAQEVNGSIVARINFSSWLGQNSKAMKNQRLLQELQYHTRLRTSTSKTEMRLDYVPVLRDAMTQPLIRFGEEGIQPVIDIMDHYFLTKEDWDSVLDFGVGTKRGADLLKGINTKTKSAFTRKYNGTQHPVAIYKTGNSIGSSVGLKQKVDYDDVVEDDTAKDEEAEGAEDGDEIDAKKDRLIKKVASKKGKAAKAAPRKKAVKK